MFRLAMICAGLGAAILLAGCTSNGGSTAYVYNDWLYHHDDWYDDDFWIWVDDHPDCCDDEDDIKQALQDWYGGLNPDQQRAVRARVDAWMDDHGTVPAAGQSARDMVLDTAAERWSALTPAERQQWLDQRRDRIEQRRAAGSAGRLSADQRDALRARSSGLSPEQYAALRESGRAVSLDAASSRQRPGRSSISHHPVPSRAALSRGSGFRSAGGRGRGGGRRR
jgi:hypothetical protein